jgi:2,4-dienoyl-CoA reductase-like NADH-dependent reductase (Old Yellow Enzyme family)
MSALLPFSENHKILSQPLTVGATTFANRLVIQPMEGADGTADGAPDTLAIRRYERFATSGAALIWFEAVAVSRESRANPRQLWLHDKNIDDFKRLVENIREIAQKEKQPNPVIIMQSTHSGRYSKPNPNGGFEPIIAYNNRLYEGDNPLPTERVISDDDLRRLEETYANLTRLAMKCGFDGIDIKACHRYLNSELFSAYERPGPYGGPLENRMRFFKNATENARTAAKPGFIVTSRMNIYDGVPYPHGFGVNPSAEPDLSEPIHIIKSLGFDLINITMGNPYFNPEVNRPTRLEGVERMYRLTKEVKDALPHVAVVASAPTFMREESGRLSAGAVEGGYADMVGFGRMAFAYPTFARDILEGKFDKKQTCITCGKCSELMRGSRAGCVVRDGVYTELYQQLLAERK